jgi:hypothetical protein
VDRDKNWKRKNREDLNLSNGHHTLTSLIKPIYQMKMQYDFLLELLFLSIFIVNKIANTTMAQAVTISRYIE